MSEVTTIGLDLAKHVFQVHGGSSEQYRELAGPLEDGDTAFSEARTAKGP
jgi:hypothetical protein